MTSRKFKHFYLWTLLPNHIQNEKKIFIFKDEDDEAEIDVGGPESDVDEQKEVIKPKVEDMTW